MQDAHRTQVRVFDPPHEFCTALFAIQGHRHGALEQRHAHDAVAQAETGVRVRDFFGVPRRRAGGNVVLEPLIGTRIGDVIPLQQRFQQLGVRGVAVVALAVVFQHQFPIGFLHQGGLDRHLGVLHVVGFHVVVQRGEELVDGRWVLGQADKHVAAGGFNVHRFEAVLRHVETCTHFSAREQQSPVQFIGPLVVMAHQFGDFAFGRGAQPRAAMATYVMKRMHLPLCPANHDDRVVAHLQGHEVALGGYLAGHACNQPLLLEDFLQVDGEQPFVVVERLWQRKGALAVLQHLGGGLACRFQWIAQAQGCGDVHRVVLMAMGYGLQVADQGCDAR